MVADFYGNLACYISAAEFDVGGQPLVGIATRLL